MTFFRRISLVIIILVFTATAVNADPIKFARYPNFSNGKIAFSYHGDIWIVNENGSNPRRLTDHTATDVFPRFSPDGKWIAFTSNRMGNNDVWIIPVSGGEAKQLTFNTVNDNVHYWTPDGERIIFSTSRGRHAFYTPLYTVSKNGGLPVPMEMDQGSTGMFSQDGSFLAFNRIGSRYWRKGYKGNRQTDIYIQDMNTKVITQLTDTEIKEFRDHVQDFYPMWGADGMIYFMSERSGTFNIWKISPEGGMPQQVTRHRDDGVQYPSISQNGRFITYENEFEIWKMPIETGRPEKITIDLDFDYKENMIEYLRSNNRAEGYFPSPEGDYLAVDYRGEIFVVPVDHEIGEKKQITSSAWRDRYHAFSPDGKHIAYVSDESLEEEIWLYNNETGERRKLTGHESQKTGMLWAGNSTKIAYNAANTLFTYDIENNRNREIAYNQAGGYRLSDLSKNGRWLVYSRADDDQNYDLYMYDTQGNSEFNISDNPFRDLNGILTPDGSKVVFTSNRDNGTYHLFCVPLERVNEDPEDPLVKEKKSKEEKKKGDEEEYSVSVNTDGIARRAVQITDGENGAGRFFLSADGETIYFTSRDNKGPGLFSIGLNGKSRKKVSEGNFDRMIPAYDKKTIFYNQDSKIFKMKLSNKKKEQVKFDFTVKVDKKAEWRQIFEESWRVMKYRFYDENMHGINWDAVKKEYLPILDYVGEYKDLYDLTNEMIGELNASHTGVSGNSGVDLPPTYRTRFLGFEMAPVNGNYKVTHIYRDGPADKEWINLNVGDMVLAIDGNEIEAGDNYWKILNGLLNEYCTVTIGSEDNVKRDIRIKTITSLRNIKYDEWVAVNREFVERESGGKIAYVHIRSMNRTSLRKFENEINQFWNAKGIIVDIRYNGGGNIDQQLLDILERRPYEFWNSRWGSRTWGRRPRQAIAGPKVMLINSRSASDSEVTPLGFRDLGLGTIVGSPTMGAVIATGSYRLIHGGRIRTPGSLVVSYDPSKEHNYGINLENYGVAPDIWVENTPEDELNGFDRELKTAVDQALKMLSEGNYQNKK